MTKSKNFWKSLLSTLWFVPMFLVIGGILLGFLLIGFDYLIGDNVLSGAPTVLPVVFFRRERQSRIIR